ncbi:MAG: ATP-binding protein, partial [Chloroflexi bacterium]|nr:ATP-binding protein [Chloroflexota bacterium]
MNSIGDREPERQPFSDGLMRLSEASLRINEQVEFEQVLQELVDSACELTGARCGWIARQDGSGQMELLATSGLDAEQHDALTASDQPSILDLFADRAEPLRIDDIPDYAESHGITAASAPWRTLLGSPIVLRGERLGLCCVAATQDDAPFTEEDEASLVLLAAQAALVISHARWQRDEERVRADLETLIDTAPVGVLVFDARTGRLRSINQEVRRIVGQMWPPGSTAEQLIDTLSFFRSTGEELPREEAHPALVEALQTGEMVRAEEITIRAPDGRSVTTLVNATPIVSADGAVESVVVSMQDMTPIEDLERLRAEFLGMVSHELRMPLAAVKGSVDTLLEASPELDPAEQVQFHRIIRDHAEHMRKQISDLLDVARIETGSLTVSPEPMDPATLVDEARSSFQSGGGRRELIFELAPNLPRVVADRRRIVQVLGNLLANAARHSDDQTEIHVEAAREGMFVAFSVADQGIGLSAERLPHLFRKFSRLEGERRERVLDGSGLGLAISKGIVEAHGGRIRAESDGPGLGSRFTFTLPAASEDAEFEQPILSGRRPRTRVRPRILCVDDDPQTLNAVREALTQAGYSPVLTGDPKAVPDLLAKHDPRLVLMDLMLPDSN